MKLWLISQKEADDYDTYDSAVVAAESEQAAKETNPAYGWESDTWAKSPDKVTAELIGEAAEGMKAGVILASFNAG